MAVLLLSVALAGGAETKTPAGSLSVSPDKQTARVGEVVVLTLDYRLPEGATLPEKPVIGGLKGLTILGRETHPNRMLLKILVDRLESLKTGAISLTFLDKDKKNQNLYADSLAIQVASHLGDKPAEAQLRPLQGIVPIRSAWRRYLPWIAGLAGLILLAAGLLWWLRRRSERHKTTILKEPPHLWAEREIGRLEGRGLFEKGKVKEFYFGLSEILRRYLEAIRGFPAAEYTVEEIARAIQLEVDRGLVALLRQADLVKFADTVPTPARKEEELKFARAYVRATSPTPETPAKGTLPRGSAR